MRIIIFIIGVLLPGIFLGQTVLKTTPAHRITDAPKIDGRLDDACWLSVLPVTDFTQYDPFSGAEPSLKTKVRIAYDDRALYIGAMMYDDAPDSIYRELGNRDDEVNADYFGIQFDTYNMQSDAYTFIVTASGVQNDGRESDPTYNAVWQSEARITDSGWIAELKIPYSAIRFPNQSEMTWGLQLFRHIRRYRESLHWALEKKGAENYIVYWGKLTGLKDIKAPLRLSLTPYVSVSGEHYPKHDAGKSDLTGSYSGGLDLKWGIDESYTLDMTLLPDFSQVRSDDLIKNITPFETKYEEYRSFFNEGIDLFEKGDLFYSRRIGRTPMGYYSVYDSLLPGEHLHENPVKARLLNATKISGRSKKGSAVGIFNAITDAMHAIVEDSLGNKRKILTEPFSNYNIFVFDQVMKNNSDIYLINTNVLRTRGYDDANATAAGITLNNKSNMWQFAAEGALSQQYHRVSGDAENRYQNTLGYRYALWFAKVRGNFHFKLKHGQVNNTFDLNDMGLTYIMGNGESDYSITLDYNIYEPFGKVKEVYNTFRIIYNDNLNTHKMANLLLEVTNFETFMNYFSIWTGAGSRPLRNFDFYESRYPGRYYRGVAYYYFYTGFSSDYRKKFALDGQFTFLGGINSPMTKIEAYLMPIVAPSNRFSFWYNITLAQSWNETGFATFDTGYRSIFTYRDRMSIENVLNARYMFMNDLSLSFRLRHYWAVGHSTKFFTLLDNGELEYNPSYDNAKEHDFNYNAFNIDLVFNWQFAPGSNLSLTWKNAILTEDNIARLNYWDNIKYTFDSDQMNVLSLKVLYYLDWQYLKKRNKTSQI